MGALLKPASFQGIAIAVTLSIGSVAGAEKAASEYKETIELSFPLNAAGEFSLDNTNGSFELTTWDKEEVRIIAEKKMRLDDGPVSWLWKLIGLRSEKIETDEDARKLFEQLAVEVSGDEARRVVKTEYPESTSGISFSVAYTVTTPRGASVRVDTTNGAIRIDDVGGGVDAESTNGSITLDDVVGKTSAKSTNGRVEIRDAGGDVSARTTNGSVTVELRRDLDVIEAIQARSVNGSVKVAIPEGVDFEFVGRTSHGSVGCEFELDDVQTERRTRLEGKTGAGGPRVELQTTNGSIRVTKLD